MGMILPDLLVHSQPPDDFDTLQGRVVNGILRSYDEPNPKVQMQKTLLARSGRSPSPIPSLVNDQSAYNRVWYELEEVVMLYSGGIQPVHTILNEPKEIPTRGALGEVSVPYTEACLEADPNADRGLSFVL